MWKEYFPAVDAVVFLIDVWDRQRLVESKAELDSLLLDEQVMNCPVLILGNKIDKIGALGEQEVRQIFNLNGITTGKVKIFKRILFECSLFKKKTKFIFKGNVPRSDLSGRPMELFMCSVLKREGYGEAFRWLSQYL